MELYDNITSDNGTEQTQTIPAIFNGIILSVAIIGISGNGLVLIVIAKVPEFRRNVTNILVGHQSFVDFITALLLLLTFQNFYQLVLDGRYHPVVENFFCKVWNTTFIYWSTYKVSTANLICVTLERYFAVVFPLQYRKHVTRRRVYFLCVFPWIVGPISEAYVLFIYVVSPVTGDCIETKLSLFSEYAIALGIFVYTLVIPLMVMIFAYVSIAVVLRRNIATKRLNMASQTSTTNRSGDDSERATSMGVSSIDRSLAQQGGGPGKRSMQILPLKEKARRNVIITFCLVNVAYAVCWTPNQIYILYQKIEHRQQVNVTSIWYNITVSLAAFNMCINPIIYVLRFQKFQQGLTKLVHRKK